MQQISAENNGLDRRIFDNMDAAESVSRYHDLQCHFVKQVFFSALTLELCKSSDQFMHLTCLLSRQQLTFAILESKLSTSD